MALLGQNWCGAFGWARFVLISAKAPINAWVRVVLFDRGPAKEDDWQMTTNEDVYSRKKAFLEGQVRRLTAVLAPSREFKARAARASVPDSDRLSDTIVDNAIYKCICFD